MAVIEYRWEVRFFDRDGLIEEVDAAGGLLQIDLESFDAKHPDRPARFITAWERCRVVPDAQ